MNRVKITVGDEETTLYLNETGKVSFTMAGMKSFLNAVEVRDKYFEAEVGDTVEVSLTALALYVKDLTVVVGEGEGLLSN